MSYWARLDELSRSELGSDLEVKDEEIRTAVRDLSSLYLY